MIKEIWHTLEDGSQVSNYGNFLNPKGVPTGKITTKGYKQVYYNKRYIPLHRLVAEIFVDGKTPYSIVNHLDGNKLNNKASNLEWCSSQRNNIHAYLLGLNHQCDLTPEEKEEIRQLYKYNDKDFGSKALSKKYGVSHTTILNIVKNKYNT